VTPTAPENPTVAPPAKKSKAVFIAKEVMKIHHPYVIPSVEMDFELAMKSVMTETLSKADATQLVMVWNMGLSVSGVVRRRWMIVGQSVETG
jgi:hypothetical protein